MKPSAIPLLLLATTACPDGTNETATSTTASSSQMTQAEETPSHLYIDDDGDGYGNTNYRAYPSVKCEKEEELIAIIDDTTDRIDIVCSEKTDSVNIGHFEVSDKSGDCDDGDSRIHPNAIERTNDQDDDCDLEIDEHLTPAPNGIPPVLNALYDPYNHKYELEPLELEPLLGAMLNRIQDIRSAEEYIKHSGHLNDKGTVAMLKETENPLSNSWLFQAADLLGHNLGIQDMVLAPENITADVDSVEELYDWTLSLVKDYLEELEDTDRFNFSTDLDQAVAYADNFDYEREQEFLDTMRSTTCREDVNGELIGRLHAGTLEGLDDPSCEVLFVRYDTLEDAQTALAIDRKYIEAVRKASNTRGENPGVEEQEKIGEKYPLPQFSQARKMDAFMFRRVDQGTLTPEELTVWTNRVRRDLSDTLEGLPE